MGPIAPRKFGSPGDHDPGRDLLSLDATGSGGLLNVLLSNLVSASWSLPGSADEAGGTPLLVDIMRATDSSRGALVQLVHPDHQTRVDFVNGLPTTLNLDLVRGPAAWSATAALPGKAMALQHQDFNVGSFTLDTQGAPGSQSVAVDPRLDKALQYQATGASGVLDVVSNWGQGYVRASLEDGVPSKFVVDANGLTPGQGSVSTQGTGSIGRASVLVVPDGGSTINRVTSSGDHAVVELMGKAPYLSLSVEDVAEFSWSVPDAGDGGLLEASLGRGGAHEGESLIVLSGPREDVTANIMDAAAGIGVHAVPGSASAAGVCPRWEARSAAVLSGQALFLQERSRISMTSPDSETATNDVK